MAVVSGDGHAVRGIAGGTFEFDHENGVSIGSFAGVDFPVWTDSAPDWCRVGYCVVRILFENVQSHGVAPAGVYVFHRIAGGGDRLGGRKSACVPARHRTSARRTDDVLVL